MNFGPSFLDFEEDRPNKAAQQAITNSTVSHSINENEIDNSPDVNYDFELDNYIQDPESYLNYQSNYPQDDIDLLLTNNNNVSQNNLPPESPNSPSSSIISNDPNYVYFSTTKLTVPMINRTTDKGSSSTKKKNSDKKHADKKNASKKNTDNDDNKKEKEKEKRPRGRPKYTKEQRIEARRRKKMRKEKEMERLKQIEMEKEKELEKEDVKEAIQSSNVPSDKQVSEESHQNELQMNLEGDKLKDIIDHVENTNNNIEKQVDANDKINENDIGTKAQIENDNPEFQIETAVDEPEIIVNSQQPKVNDTNSNGSSEAQDFTSQSTIDESKIKLLPEENKQDDVILMEKHQNDYQSNQQPHQNLQHKNQPILHTNHAYPHQKIFKSPYAQNENQNYDPQKSDSQNYMQSSYPHQKQLNISDMQYADAVPAPVQRQKEYYIDYRSNQKALPNMHTNPNKYQTSHSVSQNFNQINYSENGYDKQICDYPESPIPPDSNFIPPKPFQPIPPRGYKYNETQSQLCPPKPSYSQNDKIELEREYFAPPPNRQQTQHLYQAQSNQSYYRSQPPPNYQAPQPHLSTNSKRLPTNN